MSDHVELSGIVVEVSRDKFLVKVEQTDKIVTAQLSGKMRMHKIRVTLHDRVRVKVSPYDTERGFITQRE
jgi:translation initiation factor IF-1